MAKVVLDTSRQWMLRRMWLLSRQSVLPASRRSTEAGVTLLECLVAIIVIGLTISLIAPPLLISAASRVQNRRAEQAFQIAQAEVDRIQSLVAKGQHLDASLPPEANFSSPNAPTGGVQSTVIKSVSSSCNANYPPKRSDLAVNKVITVDVDGDCRADFYMQLYISNDGTDSAGDALYRLADFKLAVRVYSVLANQNWSNVGTTPTSLQITSSQQGFTSSSQRNGPLVALYPQMVWSDRSSTLCDYQRNTYPSATANTNCN